MGEAVEVSPDGGFVDEAATFALVETRRTNLSADQRERYSKAIDQLGDNKFSVRLGGIYALQRIAEDSDRDRLVIVQVLGAFVREHGKGPELHGDETLERYRPLDDVLAALRVIRRVRDLDRELEVDLSRAHMERTILPGADLARVDLSHAALTGANLNGADLTDAHLNGTDLTDAHLNGADLTDANLTAAYLSGAILGGTRLALADLTSVDLNGAVMIDADLSGADLTGADLTGAIVFGADLTGADLTNANLSGADLDGADLTDATLKDVAEIGQDQLDATKGGGTTRLPEGFTRPRQRVPRPADTDNA
jgi:Pentapeptide repeats (8 copies)